MIGLEQVSFGYGEKQETLSHVSATVARGECVLLCGASGCGKTTLLRMIKSELRPVGQGEGTVYYKDKPVQQLNAEQSAFKIGFVQQNPDNQIVTDYVWHELAFGLENMALPVQDIRRRVSEMASFFGMEEWFHKKTCQLSGGQKQMLNLAAVMAMDPKLLILDEPTNGLDPSGIHEIRNLIKSLPALYDCTVLISSHMLSEIELMADDIGILNHGRLLFEGELDELRHYALQHGFSADHLEDMFLSMIEQDNLSRKQRAKL